MVVRFANNLISNTVKFVDILLRSVASIAASNAGIAGYASPGGFNDFDMLVRLSVSIFETLELNTLQEIGNGGLTTAEERSHFGLWAISKSPLILGTDLTKISSASLAIIKNAVSKHSSVIIVY